MKDSIFKKVLHIASKYYFEVFIVALGIAIVSAFLAFAVHIDTDIMNLIPEGNEKVEAFKKVAQSFGTLDYLLILVETPDRETTLTYIEDIDRFGEELQNSPEIIHADYKVNTDLIDHYMENGLLYLDIESLEKVKEKLSENSISEAMKKNKAVLTSSPTSAISQLIQYDPLGLLEVFSHSLNLDSSGFKMDLMDGHYISENGKALLMIIKPSSPAQDIEFSKELLNKVSSLEKDLLSELSQSGGTVKYGGGYVIAVEDAELIKKDLIVNFLFSFIAVMILFYLCFRNLSAQLYGALPLLMGLLMTIALVALSAGEINSATTGFSALLIGLGIDFVIVMYGRYIEERQSKDHDEALSLMTISSGKAVFIGAVTTAATFYTLMISTFRGLSELGYLTATGILLCMVSIFFLLPAMLSWRHKKVGQLEKRKFHMVSFSIETKAAGLLKYPMPVIVIFIAATVFFGWHAMNIQFDDDLSNLHPEGNTGITVQKEIETIFGASFEHLVLLIEEESTEDALVQINNLEHSLEKLKIDGVISGWNSGADLIPLPVDQEKVLEYMTANREHFFYENIRDKFVQAAESNGFRVTMFEDFLSTLEKLLSVESILTPGDIAQTGMKEMLSRFLSVEDMGTRAAMYIHTPSEDIYNSIDMIDESLDAGVLTGASIVGSELNRIMKEEALIAIIIGFIAVLIILIFDFRSPFKALITFIPVAVGLVWMFGIASMLGMKLNFMSIFVSTLIIGIAVDYGLHILHRIDEEGNIEQAVIKTGRAVTIAALTTTVGFGTTAFSNYPGLQTMGVLAVFGIISSLGASLLFLPSLIKVFTRNSDPS